MHGNGKFIQIGLKLEKPSVGSACAGYTVIVQDFFQEQFIGKSKIHNVSTSAPCAHTEPINGSCLLGHPHATYQMAFRLFPTWTPSARGRTEIEI